ncbi:uncharacterized protein LOC129596067 [Paramacrobiotus metropolitanus]|uniref:uncharacterized protein LOC129596067 n=1 Tax=Paramacrobiotus metropolitanus TaxID=2943436 RepID=UPI0024461C62|nr:uncharacterized protein LOC129596067 [Paramacrobiotus metropolitanus]
MLALSLAICAMNRNSLPYITEWILFHHLQGVQRFILFDDDSHDDIMLLPELFRDAGFGDMVSVYPMNFLRRHRPSLHDSIDQYENQLAVIQHCNVRTNHSTDWLIVIDTDEFMYSETFPTIVEFLEMYGNMSENGTMVNSFQVQTIRFGTSGLINDFKGKIQRDAATSAVNLYHYANGNNVTDFPLLIELQERRAPHPDLDKDFPELFDRICHGDEIHCNHSWGKALYRPGSCKSGYIHWCGDLEGFRAEVPLQDLRVDHFSFRSKEKSLALDKEKDWPKTESYDLFDAGWFSLIKDDAKSRFVPPLRKYLERFKITNVDENTWNRLAK